jgi:hypothetical protein
VVADLHKSATGHLGGDETDRLFKTVTKRRPPANSAVDPRNNEILQQHDERLEALLKKGSTKREISAIPMQLAKDRLPPKRRAQLEAAEAA